MTQRCDKDIGRGPECTQHSSGGAVSTHIGLNTDRNVKQSCSGLYFI